MDCKTRKIIRIKNIKSNPIALLSNLVINFRGTASLDSLRSWIALNQVAETPAGMLVFQVNGEGITGSIVSTNPTVFTFTTPSLFVYRMEVTGSIIEARRDGRVYPLDQLSELFQTITTPVTWTITLNSGFVSAYGFRLRVRSTEV